VGMNRSYRCHFRYT